jgi:uncharacterized membrane-anchored protein
MIFNSISSLSKASLMKYIKWACLPFIIIVILVVLVTRGFLVIKKEIEDVRTRERNIQIQQHKVDPND